jgi:hypothetical protein
MAELFSPKKNVFSVIIGTGVSVSINFIDSCGIVRFFINF